MGSIDLSIDRQRDGWWKTIKKLLAIAILMIVGFIVLCFTSPFWFSRSRDDEDESQSGVEWTYSNSDLYRAAKTGKLHDFERHLSRDSAAEHASSDDILSRPVSPAGNTFLHVAAEHGNKDIVTFIALEKASLLLTPNLNGDTALHLAAKAGHESTVRALVIIYRVLPPENRDNLLRVENEKGNTALHEALLNGWCSVAEDLIKSDPELSYCRNNDGEYALYLAAKAGFADCVSLILQLSTDEERINEQFKKNSPIQAAIQGKHKGVLVAMFGKNPSLIQSIDDEGRNPLHYAASLGYFEDVYTSLYTYARNATKRDNSGSFPIHLAAIKGHVDVISLLLQHCPYPEELLDNDGCNILHHAAKHGRSNVVSFVLKNPHLKDLINMKDKHGNVPLHLATMNWHSKIVHDLTWDKRLDVNVVNDEGMSALDVAENSMSNNPPFTQRLTWAALKAAGTPRFLSGIIAGTMRSPSIDKYKERVNTLLIVSTLVATVTFAAGFTHPGGYNSSESNGELGMAILLRQKGFHMFVFCDTIAMYSSIIVAVALIWAQLGDVTVMLDALTLAVPLLGIALTMMSMAFTAGIFLVVHELRWLATVVFVMGITFIVILFLLFLPLCISLTSRNRVLRYLSYYPFRLMILAIGSS